MQRHSQEQMYLGNVRQLIEELWYAQVGPMPSDDVRGQHGVYLHVSIFRQLPQGPAHRHPSLPPPGAVQDGDSEAGEGRVKQDGSGLADQGHT
eukprot:2254856-Rhodomonas_salina.1